MPRKPAWLLILPIFLTACSAFQPEVRLATDDSATTRPLSEVEPATQQAEIETGISGWQRINPGGGGAFGTIGSGPTGIIIAGSDLSGAYRSLDRGVSWTPIGAAHGLTSTHVSSLAFDPLDPDVIFLGTDAGIFRSPNGGDTFEPVLEHGYITAIQPDPHNPQTVYTAYHSDFDTVDGQIYLSQDNGLTWEGLPRDALPGQLRNLELLVDSQNGDTLYLLAGEGRFACTAPSLYKSVDAGKIWKRLASDLGQVHDIAIDPLDADHLYLTTYGDVWEEGYDCVSSDPEGGNLYESLDGGQTWSFLSARTGVIWLDRDDDRAIRLIQPGIQFPWEPDNGVWESLDGGRNWKQISSVEDWDYGWTNDFFAYGSSFDGEIKSLGVDLSDPDALFWVDSQFVYASFDDGRSFTNLYTTEMSPGQWASTGIDNAVTLGLAVSAANPDHIYLGYFDMGCWRSLDRGATWQNCNHPDYTGDWEGWGGNTTALLADPTRPGVVWSVQAWETDKPGTLLRSLDSGATWEAVGAGLPAAPLTGLSLDRNSPEDYRTLFITADGYVYRSQDDGGTWVLALECGGCRYTAIDHFDGDLVYAGGEGGVWRSTNNGDAGTWLSVGLSEMQGAVAGHFWEWGWEGISAIVPSPHNPQTVYVAVTGQGKGLYRSIDSGDTWEHILVDEYLRDVAVSPLDPSVILAASSSASIAGGYDPASKGVLISTDAGASWQPLNTGMAWPFANLVAFDPLHANWGIVGSPGTGFQIQLLDDLISLP